MTLTIPAGWREIIRTARDPADEGVRDGPAVLDDQGTQAGTRSSAPRSRSCCRCNATGKPSRSGSGCLREGAKSYA